MQQSLTKAILALEGSEEGIEEVVGRVALLVYRYPRHALGWDEDDCGDFLVYFYPRLRNMVRNFRYRGRPFEALLTTALRWQTKSYGKKKSLAARKARLIEEASYRSSDTELQESPPGWTVADNPSEAGLETGEPFVSYGAPRGGPSELLSEEGRRLLRFDAAGKLARESDRRRVLYLLMKAAFDVSPGVVESVSLLTGSDPRWLYASLRRLRERSDSRLTRLHRMRERRNAHFSRIVCIEAQLSIPEDRLTVERLGMRLARERALLAKVISDIATVPRQPINRDIAEVLGVPKGSVGSGLFYLKKASAKLQMEGNSRYAPP